VRNREKEGEREREREKAGRVKKKVIERKGEKIF